MNLRKNVTHQNLGENKLPFEIFYNAEKSNNQKI